ncbi:MAG: sigma-70 family RNA polymerase sigma factor [Planctomycetota bacterium]
MNHSAAISVEELLRHAGWLRHLALRLVRDDGEADDVVQDAWARALSSPPRHTRNLRGWLGQIVHNVVRARHNERMARDARERVVAQPEQLPATDDLAANADEFRRLVECVAALEEPYRNTVLLRYFRGEAPRTIASRHGVPASTVRSRLQRAHDRLRKSLDAAHGGDRRAWVAAFVPLLPVAHKTGVSLAVAASVLVVGTTTGALMVWRTAPSPPTNPAAAWSSAKTGEELLPADSRQATRPRISGRISPPPPDAANRGDRSTGLAIRGRVLDVAGRPMAGHPLRFTPRDDGAASSLEADDTGGFVLHTGAPGFVGTAAPGMCTALAGYAQADGSDGTLTVVVVPAVDLRGGVDNRTGIGIEAARVRLRLPVDFRRRLGLRLDGSHSPEWAVETGSDGNFVVPDAPQISTLRLEIAADGYQSREVTLSELPQSKGKVILDRVPSDGMVTGWVLDPRGRPVAGARIDHGTINDRTNSDGRFELPRAMEANDLVVSALGFRPLRTAIDRESTYELVLRLVEREFEVQGSVIDSHGRGLGNVKLWAQAIRQDQSPPGAASNSATTNAAGAFAMSGFLDGSSRLIAIHQDTLAWVISSAIRRHDRPRLVLDLDRCATLRGRVVDAHGQPVPGATVRAVRNLPEWSNVGSNNTIVGEGRAARAFPSRNVSIVTQATGPSAVTDSHGSFSLPPVDRVGVQLQVAGPSLTPTEEPCPATGAVELVAQRATHLQIVVADTSLGIDSAALIDANAKELQTLVREGPIRRVYWRRFPLTDGLSEVLLVPRGAIELVLYRDGREVGRRALRLRPGEMNRLRF